MIKSFNCKETRNLFNRIKSLKLPNDIQKTALRKLLILHAAEDIKDLRIPPSNHLERLKGKMKSKNSIRINDQWRIVFRWENGNAYEAEIIDYH